jgi:hypothetical protein
MNGLGELKDYGMNIDGKDVNVSLPMHPNQLDLATLNKYIKKMMDDKFKEDMDADIEFGGNSRPPFYDEYGRVYPHWKDSRGKEFEPDDYDIRRWRMGLK